MLCCGRCYPFYPFCVRVPRRRGVTSGIHLLLHIARTEQKKHRIGLSTVCAAEKDTSTSINQILGILFQLVGDLNVKTQTTLPRTRVFGVLGFFWWCDPRVLADFTISGIVSNIAIDFCDQWWLLLLQRWHIYNSSSNSSCFNQQKRNSIYCCW